jgi:hypothetical protein
MHNNRSRSTIRRPSCGGRNIANEYFGASADLTFADLDVLAVGWARYQPRVPRVRHLLEQCVRISRRQDSSVRPGTPGRQLNLQARFMPRRAAPESIAYLQAVARRRPLVTRVAGRAPNWSGRTSESLYDDPRRRSTPPSGRTFCSFRAATPNGSGREHARHRVLPYFIPGATGTEATGRAGETRPERARPYQLPRRQPKRSPCIRAYAKRRRDLLRAGVRLYEIKSTAKQTGIRRNGFGSGASSGLHAKTPPPSTAAGSSSDRSTSTRDQLGSTRNGLGDQQSGACAGPDPILRRRKCRCWPTSAPGRGRQQPRMDRANGSGESGTTRSPSRASPRAWRSSCSRRCRSTGCFRRGLRVRRGAQSSRRRKIRRRAEGPRSRLLISGTILLPHRDHDRTD